MTRNWALIFSKTYYVIIIFDATCASYHLIECVVNLEAICSWEIPVQYLTLFLVHCCGCSDSILSKSRWAVWISYHDKSFVVVWLNKATAFCIETSSDCAFLSLFIVLAFFEISSHCMLSWTVSIQVEGWCWVWQKMSSSNFAAVWPTLLFNTWIHISLILSHSVMIAHFLFTHINKLTTIMEWRSVCIAALCMTNQSSSYFHAFIYLIFLICCAKISLWFHLSYQR